LALQLTTLNNYLEARGDNAAYVLLAKSMAEGFGYSDIYGPAPSPHVKYPFVSPLVHSLPGLLKLIYDRTGHCVFGAIRAMMFGQRYTYI